MQFHFGGVRGESGRRVIRYRQNRATEVPLSTDPELRGMPYLSSTRFKSWCAATLAREKCLRRLRIP
jgi:hypothetical protein